VAYRSPKGHAKYARGGVSLTLKLKNFRGLCPRLLEQYFYVFGTLDPPFVWGWLRRCIREPTLIVSAFVSSSDSSGRSPMSSLCCLATLESRNTSAFRNFTVRASSHSYFTSEPWSKNQITLLQNHTSTLL
jgi:hypothetical protein